MVTHHQKGFPGTNTNSLGPNHNLRRNVRIFLRHRYRCSRRETREKGNKVDRRSLERGGRQNCLKTWFCLSYSKIGILTRPPTQGGRTKGMRECKSTCEAKEGEGWDSGGSTDIGLLDICGITDRGVGDRSANL
jgi:hypothetical protein